MENMLTEIKHEDNRIRISETLIVGDGISFAVFANMIHSGIFFRRCLQHNITDREPLIHRIQQLPHLIVRPDKRTL